MAIVNIGQNGGSSGGATSFAVSITVSSGSDRVMLAALVYYGPALSISSVTYAGSGMTQVGSTLTDGSNWWLSLWRLVAPAVGTADLVATLSGSGAISLAGAAFSGVDQTTPLRTHATNTGTSTSASVAPTSSVNDVVFAAMSEYNGGTITEGSTLIYELEGGASVNSFSAQTAAAGSPTTSMSWTLGSSVAWGAIGAAMIPAGGGPTFVPRSLLLGVG